MFGNLGWGELFVVAIVILILFGSKKLPQIAKDIGKGINYFKRSIDDIKKEVEFSEDIKNSSSKINDE